MKQLANISQLIISLGQQGIYFISTLGRAFSMLFGAIVKKPEFKRNGPIFLRQIYVLGWQSFFIIAVSGGFIGMVLALQGYLVLVDYGAESRLGQMLALSLLRELGPVVTALLFAGRAGSALTAEIGLMKTTEQLASLEMMAVDPLKRVIAPRFWAGVVVVPMLTIVFISFAIIGGQWVGIAWKGIDSGSFWGSMQAAVTLDYDLGNSIIKSIIFGLIITWISLFNGYFSYPSSEGLSLATTKTVVQASLVVLGCDFILTSWMFGG